MFDPVITLADELRFLALQAGAQAKGHHRDQDEAFIRQLMGQLIGLAPCAVFDLVAWIVVEITAPGHERPRILAQVASDLLVLAGRLEAGGRAA